MGLLPRAVLAAVALGSLALSVWAAGAPGPTAREADPLASAHRTPFDRPAGAWLRFAIDEMEAGRALEAEAELARIAARHPVIADYAVLIAMRSRVESGRAEAAVALREHWERLDSPLGGEFFSWLGRAHAALGDERAARDAWRNGIDESDDRTQLAELHASVAQSLERSNQAAAAAAAHLEIWTRYPLSEPAEAAETALDGFEASAGKALRTRTAFRKRGDALFRLRRNEAALAAYDQALAGASATPSERRRAQRKRAQTLFRLRRYPEAAAAFGLLPAEDEVAIEIARAHARSGDVPRAIRELEAIGKHRSRHAVRANFLAGLLADDEGQHERARALFDKTIRRGAGNSYATAAVWRMGWAAYRAGRFDEAVRQFERLVDSSGALSNLRPRYWRARALERSGNPEAHQEFSRIAADFPFSYYGWRAAQRVEPVPYATRPDPIEPGTPQLRDLELSRPRILIAAQLTDAAQDEVTRLVPRAKALSDKLALAQLYAETGDFHGAERLMIAGYESRLSTRPAPQDLDVWWHAWPAPYDASLHRANQLGVRVEPGLVYAVMREESGYLADVVSVSGARGLLQIMPDTGHRVARRVALTAFDPDDLFVPDINIHLGSAYLEELLAQFDGRTSAAVASYNAGPQAVRRWIDTGPGADDEWVEAIPYDQTRTYVKRVMRSLNVYRVLY
jgi:soluble lytic murein transglycosylase